jgi:hypothetical protein
MGFLAALCFLPGFALARRWRLAPADTFIVAPAVSLGLIYFGGFIIYTAGLPRWSFLVFAALLLAGSAHAWRAFARCLRAAEVRPLAVAVLVTAFWLVAWQMLPRCYSGGPWYWDWLEHYYRSRLFAEHGSPQSAWGPYLLPARPPLVNVVLGVVLAHFGSHMEVYQAGYAALSALAVLPLARFGSQWGGGRAGLWGSVLLVALNPMFVQNGTFSWTRGPTSYLILLTLWLYESHRREPLRVSSMCLVWGVGALALLAHYSAGPYLVFLAGHVVIRWVRGRFAGTRALVVAAATVVVIVLPWFAWSFVVFGWSTTVGNNSSVATIAPLSSMEYVSAACNNVIDTVAPTVLLPECLEQLDQQPLVGLVRDRLFVMYEMNLWAALTLTNLVALGYLLLLRPVAPRSVPGDGRRFWFVFVAVVSVMGIVVHGPKTGRWGLAAVCLQPVVFLTLAWLGSVLGNAPRLVKALWMGATVVESGAMLALHFYMQGRVLAEAGRTAAGLVQFDPAAGVSEFTQSNWRLKITNQVTFIGDALGPAATGVWIVLALLLALLVFLCWRGGRAAKEDLRSAAS